MTYKEAVKHLVESVLKNTRHDLDKMTFCLIPSIYKKYILDEKYVEISDVIIDTIGATHFTIEEKNGHFVIVFYKSDAYGVDIKQKPIVREENIKINTTVEVQQI